MNENKDELPLILKDEEGLVLDHEADGIKELDNNLPRWWVWLFYLTIAFSAIYLLYYHVFRIGPLQSAAYERAMEAGRVTRSDRTYVPNRFRVQLHPADATLFDDDRTLLQADLADAILRRARVRGYRLVARPEVLAMLGSAVASGSITARCSNVRPAGANTIWRSTTSS